MALERFAEKLAARPLYIAIGSQDARVRSDLAVEFMATILKLQAAAPPASPLVDFRVAKDSPGHSLDDRWYDEGARFLLSLVW